MKLLDLKYLIIPLLLILPALNACVDPVGIDDNITKNLVSFDTTIVADTVYLKDSIYFVRIDTIIANKDTTINRTDTIFLPIARNDYVLVKKYKITANELYTLNGSKDYLQLPWGLYEGEVRIEVDTTFTTPVFNIKLDLENKYNVFNKQNMIRQEMADGIKLKVNGFVPFGPPLVLRGSPGNNKSAEIRLKNINGNVRYIRSNDLPFHLIVLDWHFDSQSEGITGVKVLLTNSFYSNDTDSAIEVYIDIEF